MKTIQLAILLTILSSGSGMAQARTQLFIKTLAAGGTVKVDTVTPVTSDYFEVGLYELDEQPVKYMAKNKTLFFRITEKDGKDVKFGSSMEFLNFMSERGYEMVSQEKAKYVTSYTFKKKK